MIKAVLFDMDGLMVDSRKMWRDTNTQLLVQYGKTYDHEHARQFSGLKSHDVALLIKDYYNIPTSADYLSETRNQIMLELARQPVQTMSGLTELLELLDQLGLKKAVATSSYQQLAYQLLRSASIFDKFEVIVTGEDVEHGKPAPDIFLHTARKLGVPPEHCLVLEDATVGVESAHAAGMLVVAVNDQLPAHLFPHARHVFPSLNFINSAVLGNL